MSECLSTRGEWGATCPDCGQRLPARQPRLTTWMAARHSEGFAEGGRRAAAIYVARRSRRRTSRSLDFDW